MKIVCSLFLIITCFSFSQNKQLLFGFTEIPQSSLVNPAIKLHNEWFVGVPLLSHIHAQAGSSGANVYDVFSDDNQSFTNKLRSAVYSMSENDFFSLNQQVELFAGGFSYGDSFVKTDYISFGLYQETDAIFYFPRDYAILAFEGNQTNIGRSFDLGHLNVKGEVISVLHVGYSKQINKMISVGIRGKIYSSVLNFNSINNQGSFITSNGQNNFLRHDFNLDLEFQTSGLASLTNDDNSDVNNDFKTIGKRILFGGNLGLGFDVGLSYKLTDQWQLDASLLDVGFIRHSKDIENYKLEGEYTFEGINPIFPEAGEEQTAEEYWDEISDQFEDLFNVDSTNTTKYTTLRPVKLNAALSYSFGQKMDKECNCLSEESEYQNALGMQLFAIKRPKGPQIALTAAYYRRLIKGLRVKTSWTADSYSLTNLGIGAVANIGNVNLYFLADNLLKYGNLAKAQSVSLQLGLNYTVKRNEN
jgi:hypothetical protein